MAGAMKKQRQNFSAAMKARIAVEAIKVQRMIQEVGGITGCIPMRLAMGSGRLLSWCLSCSPIIG